MIINQHLIKKRTNYDFAPKMTRENRIVLGFVQKDIEQYRIHQVTSVNGADVFVVRSHWGV